MKSIKSLQNFAAYIYIFFINFQEVSLFDFSIAQITGSLYLITILPHFKMFIEIEDIKYYVKPVVLFFCVLTLINYINIDNNASNFFSFSIFINIIFFILLANHGKNRHLFFEKGMLSLAFGSVALALFYNNDIGIEITEGRITLFGDNANIIGIRMCIAITILVYSAIQNRLQLGWYRFLLLLPIPLLIKLMAATGSRVSLVSFVLAFIAGVSLYKTKNNWTKIPVLILGLIAFNYLILYVINTKTIMSRILNSYYDYDLAGRDEIWAQLIPTIEDNFFFGIGQTGYFSLFGEGSPHNVILEILCYTGIIGLVLYLVFLFRLCICAYKFYKFNVFLLPLLLLSPIFGFILTGQILTQKLSWVIFSYIASLSILDHEINL